jgi:DNA-binding transcriptional LysR family regulator
MWIGLELRELRAFLTLAEELHYGRTAERLGVTPSRVSQTIRLLEARVGGKLFERTSRRVRLTPLGEGLRDGVAPAYEQMRQAYTEAHEIATGVAGNLRIGTYSPIAGGPRLVEIVKTFQTRHPDCRVQLIETAFTRDQLDWLRSAEADLLAMRLPFDHPDVVIGPVLSCEDRVVLVAEDNPLAERESVSYEDLAGHSVPDAPTLPRALMDAFVPPYTPSGQRLKRVDVHTTSEILMRVAAGEVVHPTVRSFLDHLPGPGVKAIPIRDLPPSETALVWLKANRSVKIDAFVRAAADVLGAEEKRGARAPAEAAPAAKKS